MVLEMRDFSSLVRAFTVEEKRISVGFGAIHCFGSSKEKKSRHGNYHKPYLFMVC